MRNDTMASILIFSTFLVLLSVIVVLVHELVELQENCQAECYTLEEVK